MRFLDRLLGRKERQSAGGSASNTPAHADTTTDGNHHVEWDPRTQRLYVDTDSDESGMGGPREALYPTLRHLLKRFPAREAGFVSAALLIQKAKIFDDGLYAAVEGLCEHGAGPVLGKRALLQRVLGALPTDEHSGAAAILVAADRLGRGNPSAPSADPAVDHVLGEFLADPNKSKPIAFYTWTDELTRIFQQDRMLQEPLGTGDGLDTLIDILHGDDQNRLEYEGYLALISRLTNPSRADTPDLRPLLRARDGAAGSTGDARDPATEPAPEPFAERAPSDAEASTTRSRPSFFPPSRSPEGDLAQRLFGNRVIPEGFELIEEVLKRFRDGRLSLRPVSDSGWYDLQLWSLEPFADPTRFPEADLCEFRDDYRDHLTETFKGVFALTRETHAKQLPPVAVGAGAPMPPSRPEVYVRPRLSAEPLPTYYLRRALGYGFVTRLLEQRFGVDAVRGTRRLTSRGPVQVDLATELREIESLFHALFLVTAEELGIDAAARAAMQREAEDAVPRLDPPLSEVAPAIEYEAGRARLDAWIRSTDADLHEDCRMMVPVFYDLKRQRTKVWMVLGWEMRHATIGFRKTPTCRVLDRSGRDVTAEVDLIFSTRREGLARPVMREAYVSSVLDRDEFRTVCDRCDTLEDILREVS